MKGVLLLAALLADGVAGVQLRHPSVDDVVERTQQRIGLKKPLMGMIDQFRAEKCADLFDKHGKNFGSYKSCRKFMIKVCKPGKDRLIDDDAGEVSSGMGFCKTFFDPVKNGLEDPAAKKAAKKAEEDSNNPLGGIGGDGKGIGDLDAGGGVGDVTKGGGIGDLELDGDDDDDEDGGRGGRGGRGGSGGRGGGSSRRSGRRRGSGKTQVKGNACATCGDGPFDDTDGDGVVNSVDLDDDGDGVPDEDDDFPLNDKETTDTDGDGIGDNVDDDIDGDGFDNEDDLYPMDKDEYADSDGDGIPDGADPDDDNDGFPDEDDDYPLDPKRNREVYTGTRFHMSEAIGVPEQGFSGKRVKHDDMKTYTDDWGNEYGL